MSFTLVAIIYLFRFVFSSAHPGGGMIINLIYEGFVVGRKIKRENWVAGAVYVKLRE